MLRKTVFALVLLGYSCLTTAQTAPVTNGTPLTVCKALESALQYDDKLVEVRGQWSGVAGGRLGEAHDCAPNVFFGQAWPSEIVLENPKYASNLSAPITWIPIDPGAFYFSFKGARAELDRVLGGTKRKGGILVTVVGRFEARAAINGAGYGEQGGWPARIIISSIKDITLLVDVKIVFP
jgi:hypothetical protein